MDLEEKKFEKKQQFKIQPPGENEVDEDKKFKVETHNFIYSQNMFNANSDCVRHRFKSYYSVCNSSTKNFSINSSSMISYAFFQIRLSPYMLSPQTQSLWNLHNKKSQRFKYGKRRGRVVGKSLKITPIISKECTKQCCH